ncbi:MAG: DUF3309 family protein [bacterium]
MRIVLIVLVLLLIFGGLPATGFHSLGYWPSGAGGILLIVLIVLLLTGRL